MNARRFVVFGALLSTLIWVNAALAEGDYQRTNDRKKTFVWNNDPQPGDVASWSGDRDADGYATGMGTLSWYKTEKTLLTGSNLFFRKKVPISHYSGTMVRGKFNGAVVTVDHGKTYHATFADGHRKGRWATGPAPAATEVAEIKQGEPTKERAEAASTAVVETPAAQATKETAQRSEAILNAARKARESAELEAPAAGPAEDEDRDQRTAISKAAAPKSSEPEKRIAKNTQTSSDEASAGEPDQSASPRPPVTKRAALAPGAVRAIEQPGHVAKKSEAQPAQPNKTAKAARASSEQKEENPASAKDELWRDKQTEEQTEPPAEGPAETKENTQRPTPNAQPPTAETKPNATPVDDSIRTLTGPPSSLHPNPSAGAAAQQRTEDRGQRSEMQAPTTAVSLPAAAASKLTAVEAMDAADIEARTKGYDLGEYQLPKAEFNASNGTWSVLYVRRDGDKSGKQLNVTIQDQNGKAEVKK